MATPRNGHATTILGFVLAVGLVIGVSLFVMLARTPARARVVTAAPVATECPPGTGAPVCYGVMVLNEGPSSIAISCHVAPGPGTAAVFANGSPDYTTSRPISANEELPLLVEVDAGSDGVVTEPSVSCAPVSSA